MANFILEQMRENELLQVRLKNALEEIENLKQQLNEAVQTRKEIVYPRAFEMLLEDDAEEHYEILKINPNYKIGKYYPYPIRRIKDNRLVQEWTAKGKNYIYFYHDQKQEAKHVAVMEQWRGNIKPKGKKIEVDHINKNPHDYHLSNLRWATRSQQSKNRGGMNGYKFDFVDKLPAGTLKIPKINSHELDDLFYCPNENQFYYFTEIEYRKLYPDIKNKIHIHNIKFSTIKFKADFDSGKIVEFETIDPIPFDFSIFDILN